MHAPKGSGLRLPEAVGLRVDKLLARLESETGLKRVVALTQLRYELGRVTPEKVKRRAGLFERAAKFRKRTQRERDQASARRMLSSAVPTLDSMRKFFNGAPQPVTSETIGDLFDTDHPEWVETAKKAKMIAAALKLSAPFEWNETTVQELRATKATTWLERELAKRVGIGAATFHNIAYRKAAKHRVAK